jgi:hypothetical protein
LLRDGCPASVALCCEVAIPANPQPAHLA